MAGVSWFGRGALCVAAFFVGSFLARSEGANKVVRHSAVATAAVAPVAGTPVDRALTATVVPHEPHAQEPEPVAEQAPFPSGVKITGGSRHRMILFTFDDGPWRHTTPRLLDLLDQLGIKAMFFVTTQNFGGGNPWEREHAEIVRDMVRRGHIVGNHTETHRQLPLLSSAAIEQELNTSEHKLEDTLGERPWLIRPPGGALSPRVEKLLQERGYSTVLWAVYGGDLEVESPDAVARTFFRVLERRQRETGDLGGIVLLHDTKPHSLEAFKRIVGTLRQENCDLLKKGKELYDIVGDPRYFVPGQATAAVVSARQARLREETRRECAALALR